MAKYSYSDGKNSPSQRGALFAILCVCMVAVGAGLWFAVDFMNGGDAGTDSKASRIQRAEHNASLTVSETTSERETPTRSDPFDGASSRTTVSSFTTSAVVSQDTAAEDVITTASFFVLPVTGNVTKEFGADELIFSETYLDFRTHNGIDIAVPVGTGVSAAGYGRVKDITQDELWGTSIIIDHGNGIVCYYRGLNSRISVAVGDAVEPSQPLGAVAVIPCECVEAAHLHFEVTENGKYISPLGILGLE